MSTIDARRTDLPALLPAGGMAPVTHDPADGLSPAPGGAAGPSAVAVLKALRRQWVLACGLGLLCSVSAAAATWLLMPASKYTAYSLLRVSAVVPSVVFHNAESPGSFQTCQNTQLDLA